MTDDFPPNEMDPISGYGAGYVPCLEAAASEPAANEVSPIAGEGHGYVEDGFSAASDDPAPDDTLPISGQAMGMVPGPCGPVCGCLAGSSGLVDSGSAITGTHTVIQSTAATLEDGFGRVIPWDSTPTGGPDGLWYLPGIADTGQQWWGTNAGGTQAPPPPNSIELDGSTHVITGWHAGNTLAGAEVNKPARGGHQFEFYDFGWKLADLGFDVTVDFSFEKYPADISDTEQFGLFVQGAVDINFGIGVTVRVRPSTSTSQIFMTRGASGTAVIDIPTLLANTTYRMRWQVLGPLCTSQVRIWDASGSEPATWDGTTTLLAPMPANASFGLSSSFIGDVIGGFPQVLRMDDLNLQPTNLYGHASVCEDSVDQIGVRQYQLRNSYLSGTITAFVEHAGYPLVMVSLYQAAANIIEDDPVAGIFSFPASISYSPAYNPTIGLGTIVTACYIVPPPC